MYIPTPSLSLPLKKRIKKNFLSSHVDPRTRVIPLDTQARALQQVGPPSPYPSMSVPIVDPFSSRNANFVYSDAATAPVLSMLSAQPGERILDFGCGSGELTHRLESLVGEKGEIWGVDANAEMVHSIYFVALIVKLIGAVIDAFPDRQGREGIPLPR